MEDEFLLKIKNLIHIKQGCVDYVSNKVIKDSKDGFKITYTDGNPHGYSVITNGYLVAVVNNDNIIDYDSTLDCLDLTTL